MKQWLKELCGTLGKETFWPLWIIFSALLFILGIIFQSVVFIVLFLFTGFLFTACRVVDCINTTYPNGIPSKTKQYHKYDDDDDDDYDDYDREYFTLSQEMRTQLFVYNFIMNSLGEIYEMINRRYYDSLVLREIKNTKDRLDSKSDIFSLEFSSLTKELLYKLKMHTMGLDFVEEKQFYEYIVRLTDISKKDFIKKHLLNLPVKKQNEVIKILAKHADMKNHF